MIKSCKKGEIGVICSGLHVYVFPVHNGIGPTGGLFLLWSTLKIRLEVLYWRMCSYRSLNLSTNKLSKMLYSGNCTLTRLQLTYRKSIFSSSIWPGQALVLWSDTANFIWVTSVLQPLGRMSVHIKYVNAGLLGCKPF